MSRIIFYIAIAIPFVLLIILGSSFMDKAGIFVLPYAIVIVTLRRRYLNLRPLWAAPAQDIIKYFTRP